jgi:signal transduction histidine kinase
MDFTAEEILQRFSRGDASRTTEGNGLGLSIAESFTQVCGGKFLLNVDGDLFKVTLQFNEVKSETI